MVVIANLIAKKFRMYITLDDKGESKFRPRGENDYQSGRSRNHLVTSPYYSVYYL